MSGHTPWRDIKRKVTPEGLARARKHFDELLAAAPEDIVECAECGRMTANAERDGFMYWSDGVGELIPYCTGCAAREFGRG